MILTDADHLREALELVRQERDRARAERDDAIRARDILAAAGPVALREIAERQRQACANYMAAERWYTTLACLSAPLVTDKDKP